MKKRIGGAFSSPATDSTSLHEVDIYNVFPDIRDPRKRAYYLPVIDAIYLPIIYTPQVLEPKFYSRAFHEVIHAVVAGSYVSCKLRELAFFIMGAALDFIMETDEPGYQLLVPSFKMVGPNEEDDGLTEFTVQYEELWAAAQVIHEIAATTAQVEGYSRAKALKDITDHLQDEGAEDISDKLLE
jgi:hypothetical protein